jgi:acetylornithine deacetylase/succinyl-diaminopimelate desuccinylase-like protein
LAWLRALDAAGVRTRADVLFVADVGEEGEGDLRYLFQNGRYKDGIGAFITVDSPMFAMADAIARLSRIAVPAKPRTTFSASVTGGGTSINSIPNSVWTEFDLRSESPAELARLEASFLDLVSRSVTAENMTRSTRNGPVTTELRKIGDRPAGRTDKGSALVRLAHAALLEHGFQARFETSSTDANIPMSLGIPAIKIGSGGTGGRAHSPEEWIDVEPQASVRGMAAGLTTVLGVAGVVQ